MRGLSIILFLSYPAVTHYAVNQSRPLLAIGVLIALLACLTLNFLAKKVIAWLFLILIVLFLLLMPIEETVYLLYLPPVLVNICLCWFFGRTLYGKASFPHEPLISYFARLEGNLTPEIQRYTYILTWLWTVFFALMASIAIALAIFGPFSAWVLFTGCINYLLAIVFFAVEYIYRKIRFPNYIFLSPLELMRRVKKSSLLVSKN
jgi:uncharacterized membrane protein